MPKQKVILGFSGGIDSVTAAHSLREEGYQVIALTLDTMGDELMLARARESAQKIGVKHIVLDVRESFRERIIEYFIQSYSLGRTPAPCTMCNPLVKWHYLEQYADWVGAEKIATGHYFNIEQIEDKFYVSKADDLSKDQSYYLWGLSQGILSRAITPMGHRFKEEVKRDFSNKKESMGVCFLAGESYRDYLMRHSPQVVKAGEIVTKTGEIVGRHDGVAFYTIGQKRGLDTTLHNVAIIDIDATNNRLIIGNNEDLYHSILEVKACNIVNPQEFLSSADIHVVVRGIGRNPEGYISRVEEIDGGYRIHLENPAWAPAIGQPVVFYRDKRVIGGGVLEKFM